MNNPQINLHTIRHSAEHVMHQAVKELFPKVHLAMGPATDDGFYNDFDPNGEKVTEEDFSKIEKRMRELIELDLPITKVEITEKEAKKLFNKNPYKLEWVSDFTKDNQKLTVYWTGKPGEKNSMVDLCRGPHVASTGKVGVIKLLSIAGAYWHGDEKNKMLTRIYGTAFPTQEELDKYLWQIEEAKKRDHRVIGKNLGLFVFTDLVGKGLPLFTEKGSIIRRELEQFIVKEEIKRGYSHVYTPDLAKVDLYEKSGHYPYYKDVMYPVMKVDEEELILRPMTCPHHFQLYASKPHTYKELPVRFAELAKQFRYEKSGELTGLMRVRAFCLADAHIICKKDQAVDEINSVLDLIEFSATVLGLIKGEHYRYRLSLGDITDGKKYYKDDEAWATAENVLRKVLISRNAPYFEEKNEAAFYGPKIDIQMKNFSGKEDTAFTVQYDFVMPKRFELTYIDADGKEKEPVVIHRSSIGCIERVMAFLIEHYAGAFPVWLAPEQVIILPVSDKSLAYAHQCKSSLKSVEIRASVDERPERLQAKIRDAEMQKIPYMLIVGPKEAESESVSVRLRGERDKGVMKLDEFVKLIKEDIESKRQI